MNERWNRLAAAALGLALVGVVVFWSWPGGARITFDDAPVRAPGVPVGEGVAPRVAAGEASMKDEPAPVPEFTEHTVRPGDTLGGLAVAYYGNAAYKDSIFEANRDRLSDPNRLRAGIVLRIPRRPSAPDGRP
jgi:nucleoid-associated protein YgaU